MNKLLIVTFFSILSLVFFSCKISDDTQSNTSTPSFSYTAIVSSVGMAITASSPQAQGGFIAGDYTFADTDGLVAATGLSFSTATGVISGAATTAVTQTNYTITATKTSDNSTLTAEVSITVTAAITFSYNAIVGAIGLAITASVPQALGGFIASDYTFADTDGLVAATGLSFSTTTGEISGTPTTEVSQTNYTITATKTSDNSTLTAEVSITITATIEIAFAGGAALPTEVTLLQGFTVKLKTRGNIDVDWTSSDNTLFSVTTGGVVKAEAATGTGMATTATITATAKADATKTKTLNFKIQALAGSQYENRFSGFASMLYNYVKKLTTTGATTNITYNENNIVIDGQNGNHILAANGYVAVPSATKLVVSKASGSFVINTENRDDKESVAVWIDWNIDGYFYGDTWQNAQPNFQPDSNEFYALTKDGTVAENASRTIIIPPIARVGTLRMRIQSVYSDSTTPAAFYGNAPQNFGGGDMSIRDFEVEITE